MTDTAELDMELERLEQRARDGLLVEENLRLKKCLVGCRIVIDGLLAWQQQQGNPAPKGLLDWRKKISDALAEN